MKRQHVVLIGGLALLVLIAVPGIIHFWLRAPDRIVELTATWPDGRPLEHVSVEALGEEHGETDADGKLSFRLRADGGEEVVVSASLDRPGAEFDPWKDSFIVRKWDREDPESLRYSLKAVLVPRSLSAVVEVLAGGDPVSGAKVRVAGKTRGTTDSEGRLAIELGSEPTRSVEVSVSASGFKPWSEKTALAGGETILVSLEKIGAISARVTAAYEKLGQVMRIRGAEATLGGRKAGRTDANGRFRFSLPMRGTNVTLRKDGFLPVPAERRVRPGQGSTFVMTLFPEKAPTYRVAVLPPTNGSAGNRDVEAALSEIEDKLSDYLHSYGVFERVESREFLRAMRDEKRNQESILKSGWAGTRLASMADAVISSQATLDDDLVLAVEVVSVTGKRLGAFAETQPLSRVRSLAEDVSEKIRDIFPFEGYVSQLGGSEVYSTLSSADEREPGRGDAVEVYRWTGSVPPKPKLIARGKIHSVDRNGSRIELGANASKILIGDKVVLLPRLKEAAFSAALDMTVMAGAEGSEVPFADVNVYRDGDWVGTTSEAGRLRVPVAEESWHAFLFVKGGLRPHKEDLYAKRGTQKTRVLVPQTMTLLRIESEPTGSRVLVDGREVGRTPVETRVVMGFRRVRVESDEGWRPFDEVLELTSVEEEYTGSRRIVLQRDVLKEAEMLLSRGEVDEAAAVLGDVGTDHPDYSAAHNLLGGIYLDQKNDPERAIEEFESVLALPENRELVNKRFTVTFLNLGRAYFKTGTPEGYREAIRNLEIARDNKRFFPRDRYDLASHDTLYFLALASHKLYHQEPDEKLLRETSKRWKDYFDFFPEALRADADVQRTREGAEQFFEEIRLALRE